MLKVLGTKKIAFIVVLLALTGLGGYGYYDWLVPERERVTGELQTTKSAVSQKYADVARMKEEYVLLQSQLKAFKELEARGFFNDQDRSAAIEKLEKLSGYAKLLKANLKFGAGQPVADPLAEQAKQTILKSPVVVSVSALDDVDVYSFIKFIEEKFPGDVDITSVKLRRIEIFNEAMLRKIGGGDPSPLIEAELDFDWLTMTSKDVVTPIEGGN